MPKQTLAIICGGQSTEHEVSLISAKNIIKYINSSRFEVQLIYISHQGMWYWVPDLAAFISAKGLPTEEGLVLEELALNVATPGSPWFKLRDQKRLSCDVVFPVVHGTTGEDGQLQGLLEMLHLPYVGSGVKSSAICMDKDITKRLLLQAEVPVIPWIAFKPFEARHYTYEEVSQHFGSTELFVKPATLGSSVGITRVTNAQTYDQAVALAFQFDHKIMVEPELKGRELEISVMGLDEPLVSLPGELLIKNSFYDFKAKYVDSSQVKIVPKAELPPATVEAIQQIAARAYVTLGCEGMARIDFRLGSDGPFINEVNTIPGFTTISMYPMMWAEAGINFTALIDKLVDFAYERFVREEQLQRVCQDASQLVMNLNASTDKH